MFFEDDQAAKNIQPRSSSPSNGWQLKKEDPTCVEPAFIVELWQILQKLNATDLEKETVETIIRHSSIFDPGKTLVPAIKRMEKDNQNQNLTFLNFGNMEVNFY